MDKDEGQVYMNMERSSVTFKVGGPVRVEPGLPKGLLSPAEGNIFSSFGKTDISAVNIEGARGNRLKSHSRKLSVVEFRDKKELSSRSESDVSAGEDDIYEVPAPMALIDPRRFSPEGIEDYIYDIPTSSKVVGVCHDEKF